MIEYLYNKQKQNPRLLDDSNFYNRIIDLHRDLFQIGLEIPDWITRYLDVVWPAKQKNKILFKKYLDLLDHGNPLSYGLDNQEVAIMRERYQKAIAWNKMQIITVRIESLNTLKKSLLNSLGCLNGRTDIFIQAELLDVRRSIDEATADYNIQHSRYYNTKEKKHYDFERIKQVDMRRFLPSIPSFRSIGREKYFCPFHKEKTPSFIYFTDENKFHCFGCGLGGNVIDFYMKFNNCDFLSACRELDQMV